MTAICPVGYNVINGICYSSCPSGTSVLESYPDICVSTLPCPVGTTEDVTGLTCDKVPPTGVITKDTTCPTNYTEWTTGVCYLNCPSMFLDNGTDCRKKVIPRLSVEAWCSYPWQQIRGNACTTSSWIFWFLVFLVALAAFVIVVVGKRKRK